MATVEQERQQRRNERKRLKRCPGCGVPKPSNNNVYCAECRANRLHWDDLPVAPRFPGRLPVAPLHARVENWLKTNMEYGAFDQPAIERSIASLGLGIRRFNEWQAGRASTVSVGLADRVLTALSLDWLDVWTREEHPRFAACLDAIDALGEAPADGFCPECSEPVASVNGTCPWHPVPVVVESYLGSEDASDERRKEAS